MAINFATLTTEINTDPMALGYAGKNDAAIAGLLNAVGLSGEIVDRSTVTSAQIQEQVVGSEFAALSAVAQRLWLAILSIDVVPVKNANLRAQVLSVWAAGTTTRSNLAALQTKSATRAEVLFGENVIVTHQDVAKALGRV